MKALAALLSLFSVVASVPLSVEHGLYSSLPKRQTMNSSVLTFYPAPSPNGDGVLVVPGGGYAFVSLDYEGANTTAYLNERGYHVWVLNYATSSTAKTPLYPLPQNQALQAVKQIRGLKTVKKLGIWGFSAGGHLAATTITNPEAQLDYAILAYPVITMDPTYTHQGSRTNLIGGNPSPELQSNMSAQNRVSDSTPPVFLFHTANDHTVPIQNTLFFASAMANHSRPFQTLILPDGPHGLGLALNDPVRNWMPELERWMKYSI